MKLNRFALPLLVLALGTSVLLMAQDSPAPQGTPPPKVAPAPSAPAPQGPPPPGVAPGPGGWDAPPPEFREVQRQGFHDGIEAARKDFENHHPPDAAKKSEFRHPPVPPPARDEYRDGFRRGYDTATSHLQNGPGPR